jgi:SAM-dependent methyltransferase
MPLSQVLADVKRILDKHGSTPPSLFFPYVRERGRVNAGSVVLDVGGSCGRHLWELKEHSPCSMAALDIEPVVLEIGSLAWRMSGSPVTPTWIAGDGLELPFRDNAFTHILSNVTLILLPIRTALVEWSRVLKPGGQLIFTFEGPGAWRNYWDLAGPGTRHRLNLLRARLGSTMLEAGFDWQNWPLLRRLSCHNQLGCRGVARLVNRAGLIFERCDVIKMYRNEPHLLGIVAHKAA